MFTSVQKPCFVAFVKVRVYRPLSHGGHFKSQENKKLCFCPSSLALRLDGQNLLFQQCVIKVYCVDFFVFFVLLHRGWAYILTMFDMAVYLARFGNILM